MIFVGCTDEGWSNGPADPAAAFRNGYATVLVEVDYEPKAKPYVEPRGNLVPWTIFQANVEAVFGATSATVNVPLQLSGMQAIDDQAQTDFSSSDVLSLAERYRTNVPSDDQLVYYILFLDGYFESEGKRQSSVLGITLAEKRTIAVFKPVIEQNPNDLARVFAEQSTLVHEFGHAIGLVNNGLPLVSAHHDAEHGAHCTNQNCVMYYLNEGFNDLFNFAQQLQATGSNVMLGEECLQDIYAATPDDN